jgi:hypothetical protein
MTNIPVTQSEPKQWSFEPTIKVREKVKEIMGKTKLKRTRVLNLLCETGRLKS